MEHHLKKKHAPTRAMQFTGTRESAAEVVAWAESLVPGMVHRITLSDERVGLLVEHPWKQLTVESGEWVLFSENKVFYHMADKLVRDMFDIESSQ